LNGTGGGFKRARGKAACGRTGEEGVSHARSASASRSGVHAVHARSAVRKGKRGVVESAQLSRHGQVAPRQPGYMLLRM
jgi:hypothetical protein